MAYYGIFSLAPMLVIMVGAASLWFGREAAEGLLVERLEETLGPEAAAFVQSILARAWVSNATFVATAIAVLMLLWGASRVLGSLRRALNEIWDVEGRAGGGLKGFVLTKVFDLSTALVIGILFLSTMMANAAVSALVSRVSDVLPLPAWTLRVGSVAFSLIVVGFIVGVGFRVVPNTRVPLRATILGATVTAVLFTAGNYVMGLYLGRAGIGSVFGAAGALAVIMFWIYYSAQIVLFGAELTKSYNDYRLARSGQTPAG